MDRVSNGPISLLLVIIGFFAIKVPCIGQNEVVPKAGWSLPLRPPIVDSFLVDSRNGVILGIEIRKGDNPVYFNPGVYAFFNRLDIYLEENSENRSRSDAILTTHALWVKGKIGVAGKFRTRNEHVIYHLRGGLSLNLLVDKPNLNSIEVLRKNYRSEFVEFHAGFGLDIKNITFDVDYNLSFVRHINTSDVVENTVMLTAGIIFERLPFFRFKRER